MRTNSESTALSVQVFTNSKYGEVRTSISPKNKPLFCLVDVCNALDLQTNKVKQRLDADGCYDVEVPDALGRPRPTTFITLSNFFRCVMRSNKPEAEEFQDWICDDVAPAILTTGVYIHNSDAPLQAVVDYILSQHDAETQEVLLEFDARSRVLSDEDFNVIFEATRRYTPNYKQLHAKIRQWRKEGGTSYAYTLAMKMK